ncbi:integrase [Streptomyces griseoincarnatus]
MSGSLAQAWAALPGVPLRRGGHDEEGHVDEHGREGAAFALAQARPAVDCSTFYQHYDEDRQREVAAGLDDLVRAERAKHHTDDRVHYREEPSAG